MKKSYFHQHERIICYFSYMEVVPQRLENSYYYIVTRFCAKDKKEIEITTRNIIE